MPGGGGGGVKVLCALSNNALEVCDAADTLDPTPYTLRPTSYTLHRTP